MKKFKNYRILLVGYKEENVNIWIDKLKENFIDVKPTQIRKLSWPDGVIQFRSDVNFQSNYSTEKNYNLLNKIYPTTIFKN